ncbi:MAG: UvrD-helicase domain-containing protein [Bacteroidales bacterium]|nr:UvrD-helicase domain-containing protein [Bacteroidales bacterium]
MLKVYSASAGSGKTHHLTEEYIKLLFRNNDAYKHILAVTFTNKATDEMKSRVIEKLYSLSKENTADGQKAKKIITDILHDYSSFAVSTIDKFFQQTMRAFAREIGEYSSYKVELDSSAVLSRSVDMMMSSLEEDKNGVLLDWLLHYSIDLIERGKKWDVTSELREMSKLFLSEDFKLKKRGLVDLLNDKSGILNYREKLNEIISSFRKDLILLGKKGVNIISGSNLSYDDFKGGTKSPFKHFVLWADGGMKVPTETFINLYDNIDIWYKSGDIDSLKIKIKCSYDGGLNDVIGEINKLFEDGYKSYMTALLINENIYLVGIFADIYGFLTKYLKDNNVVLLGETADVLNRIIDGSDTPFVYEKIGCRYDNLMLDEFQDTSVLQWENFKPLFLNSIASGNDNLIVGDVKQSIYRWRGSDWNLLDKEIGKTFGVNKIPLIENWRSCENIVDFNNELFGEVGEILQIEKIKSIYADSGQKYSTKMSGKEGHVKLNFIEQKNTNDDSSKIEEWQKKVLTLLPDTIKNLKNSGYDYKDITILVRKNIEGAQVAGELIAKGYAVVTEDSLLIGSSEFIGRIVASLKYLLDPEDKVNNIKLSGIKVEANINYSSLYDICEEIIRCFPEKYDDGEIPFIQAFMDAVLDYTSKYGSDINGFVKWWDDSGKKRPISAPRGQNAIRIMTIHKSKGLGFKATIIPFFKEKFISSSGQNNYIWCKPQIEPFREIGLIPLKASSALKNTIFSEEYEQEKLYSYIDSINTSYVACTRAKNELIIFAPKPKANTKGEYSSEAMSDILYKCFEDRLDNNGTMELGKWYENETDENVSVNEEMQDEFISVPIGDRLKLSLRGGDFFDLDNHRRRGIVMHNILSRINSAGDLKKSIEDAIYDGELSRDAFDSTYNYMEKLIKSVSDKHWFDNTYSSYNELSIINIDGSVSRPDRVLVDGTKAIVIDYKFGPIKHKSYERQVAGYMMLLSEIGFTQVEGYLWEAGNLDSLTALLKVSV